MGALSLLKDTGVYKTVLGDKRADRVSHAYLVLSQDKDNLIEYLKVLASLIVCKEGEPCGGCRNCTLIDSGKHADVIVVDKENFILAEDVNAIIDESFGGKVHVYVLNFLKLLTEKQCIRCFEDCCKVYQKQ